MPQDTLGTNTHRSQRVEIIITSVDIANVCLSVFVCVCVEATSVSCFNVYILRLATSVWQPACPVAAAILFCVCGFLS